MGAISIWHILILAAIALVLFGGRGKISGLMGDVGQGISKFKAGLTAREAGENDASRGLKTAGPDPVKSGEPLPR